MNGREILMQSVAFAQRVNESYKQTCSKLSVMQLNITRVCNLACNHCHLMCGPHRTEQMAKSTMELALDIFQRDGFEKLDITGGAVETHPDFEWLITEAHKRGFTTIVRTNLAILEDTAYAHFAEIYARLGVEIVASLPCYTQENVDAQRGTGTYLKDIAVIKRLNSLGYGSEGSGLLLNLVYNPGGAFLPGQQDALEDAYKEKLAHDGMRFNHLYTITNMNVGRFAQLLNHAHKSNEYAALLEKNFNPSTTSRMMCREQINIAPDGSLYDCDFNQALDLPIKGDAQLDDFKFKALGTYKRAIVFGPHCYACTAGSGSSCTGTTTQN